MAYPFKDHSAANRFGHWVRAKAYGTCAFWLSALHLFWKVQQEGDELQQVCFVKDETLLILDVSRVVDLDLIRKLDVVIIILLSSLHVMIKHLLPRCDDSICFHIPTQKGGCSPGIYRR